MATLTKEQTDAAGEFANATIAALKIGEGVHPPTIIAASARMAGTYLFRSFDLELPGLKPGQVVLSEAANEQSAQLIQITAGILSRIGTKIADSPPDAAAGSRHKQDFCSLTIPAMASAQAAVHVTPLLRPLKPPCRPSNSAIPPCAPLSSGPSMCLATPLARLRHWNLPPATLRNTLCCLHLSPAYTILPHAWWYGRSRPCSGNGLITSRP